MVPDSRHDSHHDGQQWARVHSRDLVEVAINLLSRNRLEQAVLLPYLTEKRLLVHRESRFALSQTHLDRLGCPYCWYLILS